MKYIVLILVLLAGCTTAPPVVLYDTDAVTVYGCEESCPDSLKADVTYGLDTLGVESVALVGKARDTVRVTDTLVVAPTILCTSDDLETKRVEWKLDGWLLSERPVAVGLISKKQCLAATRK